MRPQQISHMFTSFTFIKPSQEIRDAATRKIEALTAKLAEREARVAKLRETYNITDAALVELLQQAVHAMGSAQITYTVSNKGGAGSAMDEDTITIGAGTVNALLTENKFIESEREQITKLRLIVRNLQDLPDDKGNLKGHALAYDELVYLGF